jgi:hypothetical protein
MNSKLEQLINDMSKYSIYHSLPEKSRSNAGISPPSLRDLNKLIVSILSERELQRTNDL